MSTTPTKLPVPSEKPQDLKFNSGKIDEYVTSMGWTYSDRFGVKHYTIEGISYLAQQVMNSFGYVTLSGVTFTTGAIVSNPNEVLFNTADNTYYKWTGSFISGSKVVPANSTPQSSGGIGAGMWLSVGDATLRGELTSVKGFELVGKVKTFSDLRGIIPNNAGEKLLLNSYSINGVTGGGTFVAVNGTSIDDGGVIAKVNPSWYWKREVIDVITPEMFGGDSTGINESFQAVKNCALSSFNLGMQANYTGAWNLSVDVIVGGIFNSTGDSKIIMTGSGKIIFSGTTKLSNVKQKSTIVPNNSAPGVNASGSSYVAPVFNEFFVNQSLNNQGLAYYDGYYYVGYDTGSGNGIVERYASAGVIDSTYGGVTIPINHAADLAYRLVDGRVYVASGGGAEPTYVRKLAADGKSVETSIDLTAYGNSALCAIDNANDILILHSTLTGGDTGLPTFTFFNFDNYSTPIKQFTLSATLGTPQGMDVFEGVIYFYTNNKVNLINYDGEVVGQFNVVSPGESEGIAVVADYGQTYIAVGYNTPRRVMSVRSPYGMTTKNMVFPMSANPANSPSRSHIPFFLPFSIRKLATTAGSAWTLTTYSAGNNPKFDNVWQAPTINSTDKQIEVKFKYSPVGTIFSASGSFNASQFAFFSGGPYQIMCDVSSTMLMISLVKNDGTRIDPATLTGTGMIWGQVVGGMPFNSSLYPS